MKNNLISSASEHPDDTQIPKKTSDTYTSLFNALLPPLFQQLANDQKV
jgi:hypothetical protein